MNKNFSFRITRGERKQRAGFLALTFFTIYLVEPTRAFIDSTFHINPFLFGIAGIIAALYFFDLHIQ